MQRRSTWILVTLALFDLSACFNFFSFRVCAEETRNVEWMQFRGTRGNGHHPSTRLPTIWGGFLDDSMWRCDLPGIGWSSPIVVGSSVWLTSAEVVSVPDAQVQSKLDFDPEGPLYFQTHATVTFYAIEVELNSGKLLRKLELLNVQAPPPIHALNSYATPTPASDGQTLVCHFGSLGTTAIDLTTGAILWKKTFRVEDITGPGSSPVIYDDQVFLVCDGADEQYVVALELRSGNERWRTNRPPTDVRNREFRRAFSTPSLLVGQDRVQLIAPTAQWLVSYDPKTGNEWWRCRTTLEGYSVVPQVALIENLAITSTGFMKPELWAIRTDGSGDVSTTHVAWKRTRQAPDIASPLVVGERLYTVSSGGILSCCRWSDGSELWQKRLEGQFGASPVFGNDKIYVVSREGITFVLEPGETYSELARNETFGRTQATPALASDRIIIRSDSTLFGIAADSPSR